MYPALLVPLLFVWMVYGPSILYLEYFFPWDSLSQFDLFVTSFGVIFFFSGALSLSCFWLLELIRRIEAGESLAPITAFPSALKNTLAAIHVVLAWAIIWFVLAVLSAIFSRKGEEEDKSFSAENAARTLSGSGSFSLSSAFFDAISKGVRMVAFLIFPAFAWESSSAPIKRGLSVARTHAVEFSSGFVLTELAAAVIFLPPALVFLVADKTDIVLGDGVWVAVMIYCAFAWSVSILLEQLFTAELYLWDMKWRKACDEAKSQNKEAPALRDVPRPSILDNINEFDEALGRS